MTTDIANFPSLTGEEFEEACHHLDSRYRRAALGPLRQQWKLRLQTALDATLSFQDMPRTIVEITRPLQHQEDEDLDLRLGDLAISGEPEDALVEGDQEMMDNEESDKAVLARPVTRSDTGFVTYDIVLHPTYRMPCLYFRLWSLPSGESPFDIDTVFRHLVPDAYKAGLHSYGGIGGISIDNHPIYGEPCFFVHPCLMGENMAAFQCSREDYLTIWIGLTGACVGLSIPKEMMIPR